ncbi:MAG TPA: nuclear transport factor 2 family protein [Candidatus Binataceae bacterium]|nr:nuclear transport factor 2 family protein [Candidatus Binataceae bacterium]
MLVCVAGTLIVTPRIAAAEPQSAAESEQAIRQATLAYYVALNSVLGGDPDPMTAVWSHGSDVSNLSAYGERAIGWNEVQAGYRNAARRSLTGRISPSQIVVVVSGAMGFSVCDESGELRGSDRMTFKLSARTTNIFRLENGKWKLVHHHTDPVAELSQR